MSNNLSGYLEPKENNNLSGYLEPKANNNSSLPIFFGQYIEFRKSLDYTYFDVYSEERQKFQDIIINRHLEGKKSYTHPWLISLCGPFGVGKSHLLKTFKILNIQKEDAVYIDPDKIKYELPEAKQFIKTDPINAGSILHKESTFIALLIQNISFQHSYIIISDGSLRNVDWYKKYFKNVRERYSHYKLGIIKVNASLETILERCKKRGKETGRIISENLIKEIYYQIPQSYDILKKYMDINIEINNENENGNPIITSIIFSSI
jgi:predicted ABC-type ATPase